ncbi:FH1/FH2 domain-containing protein 1 isoform X2 [Eurytemora carolleeae]|uniref:FH1/FH2 domain-containing protein 1 isoform X2 n=1 Tax=Eurytemora carolleeae TaxID=1294199 RepID=UPI000C76B09B|nr:FH1/FH2 domain-containing protein 1 isoform X2 [Eurytemora carolleeae]|eukprot:XP_023323709.1 FH1/FH2 domain-containing protein 1-like isoform X2 [Eurytemora affinis]
MSLNRTSSSELEEENEEIIVIEQEEEEDDDAQRKKNNSEDEKQRNIMLQFSRSITALNSLNSSIGVLRAKQVWLRRVSTTATPQQIKQEGENIWKSIQSEATLETDVSDFNFSDLDENTEESVDCVDTSSLSSLQAPPPPTLPSSIPSPPPLPSYIPPHPTLPTSIPPPPPLPSSIPPPPPLPSSALPPLLSSIPPPPQPLTFIPKYPEPSTDSTDSSSVSPAEVNPPISFNETAVVAKLSECSITSSSSTPGSADSSSIQTVTAKLVKLHWRPVVPPAVPGSIWESIPRIDLDSSSILSSFTVKETKPNSSASNSAKKELRVLDTKRSNQISIGIKNLPKLSELKATILKMDDGNMSREGVEKLQLLMPTEEEIHLIKEAEKENPGIPLASAEQYLLTIYSIPGLDCRLKLWAFKLDYQAMERDICSPLRSLLDGVNILRNNENFAVYLSIILSMGNLLNRTNIRGFNLEYLGKISLVKDTDKRRSLLYHIVKKAKEQKVQTDFIKEFECFRIVFYLFKIRNMFCSFPLVMNNLRTLKRLKF